MMNRILALLLCLAAPVLAGPPPVAVRSLQGATVSPLAAHGQKATCLLFIAHDCPISNKYAPEFNRIAKEYAARKVAFYVVYCEADGKPADAVKHYKDFGYACPGLLDPKHALVKLAGATVTPEAAVFDSAGKLAYRGRIDNLYVDFGKPRYSATVHDLRRALDSILAGKPAPVKTTKAVGCFIYEPG
jgi:thiol-disulfide isomerase/thioredoxin